MKPLSLLIGMALVTVFGLALQRVKPVSASREPLAHVRTTFEFTVRAPYKVAAPLFGAEAERAWGGVHWDPQFLYPQPAQDKAGAVFTVAHGQHQSVWVNTVFDLENGNVQYVSIIDGIMVTKIDIHLAAVDANTARVNVAYERTALNADANVHVRQFGKSDQENGKEWDDAINGYLAHKKI
jgi:hypothetical protein